MKDVLIEITGTQKADGESEKMEMTTVGKLITENGLWKLIYNESNEDSSSDSVTTLMIDCTGAVTLDRTGENDSHMTVQKGRRHMSLYSMGPCEFTLGTFGEAVDSSIGEHGGQLIMRYTVDINSAFASSNEIKIKVREI